MTCSPHYCTKSSPKRDAGPWMSKVENRLLSDMTIPGTHDSCCEKKLDFCQTQTYSLPEQFKDGIRFVDIRCRHINNVFAIHHGMVYCGINFGEVLKECREFLKSNPKECLLMRVQEEYKEEGCTQTFQETFKQYYEANEDILSLKSEVPYLDEIRGKVWVLRNFDYNEGFYWRRASIQDEYEVPTLFDIPKKEEHVKDQLNAAIKGEKEKVFINFCSGVGYLCWPYSVAEKTNKVPMDYKGRLGIVVMDFPGEDVVQHLFEQNY